MTTATYKKALFIFRRDLRLNDNTGLIKALKESEQVIPCFIFDPRQVTDNDYRADNCVQFMLESLQDLNEQLEKKNARLYYFYGKSDAVVRDLVAKESIDAVYLNRDYTPFSIHRDLTIENICTEQQIGFWQTADYLLNEPGDVRKNDGGVYSVYSPFMRKSMENEVALPVNNRNSNYYNSSISMEATNVFEKVLKHKNPKIYIHGGRSNALKILKKIGDFDNYDDERNLPAIKGTTGLSAHNKIGTCSIREVYHAVNKAFGKGHTLIRELYWRDFFTHVGFHNPDVLGNPYYEKYNKLKWSTNKEHFKRWCDGQTGYPIVDAGMRELNTTGFMHNRVRMIAASFLVKDLQIDWRWGEKYFAQKLIDYDPFVNNGNWQWVASTGCDVQPYFRIFNPWRQQERFDPDCVYIKKWIPELKSLSAKEIHKWQGGGSIFDEDYPEPMVDHSIESAKAKEMYKVL